jgi:hypothetical protein
MLRYAVSLRTWHSLCSNRSGLPNPRIEEASMRSLEKNTFAFPWLLLLLFVVNACAPAIKSNIRELEARTKNMKRIVLLPPEIKICELTAGGVKEKRDDWCETGKKNVENALTETMKGKGLFLGYVKSNRKNKKEIADINALYKAVALSIYNHTFRYEGNTAVFPEKIEKFDYSIGSVEGLLAEQKADGLLIVYGADEISSQGRKALQVFKAINPFDRMDAGGVTSMIICLTDKTGAILWFRTRASAGSYDLRDRKSAYDFVSSVFDDYPGGST